jgi:4-hydroxybenzoate polyprenyltransferase
LTPSCIAPTGASVDDRQRGVEPMPPISDRAMSGLAVAAALLVLFSALWEPWLSATIAIVSLLGIAVYSYFKR